MGALIVQLVHGPAHVGRAIRIAWDLDAQIAVPAGRADPRHQLARVWRCDLT